MKLEPKAKPIRIRLKIGKEEYSTFESLRENLNFPELYPLFIDGVFIKWLRQVGESQRAERAEKIRVKCNGIKDVTQNYILLLSLFDKEVEQSMSKYNYSVDTFFANTKLDILLELHSKHGFSVNWSDVIRLHLQRMKPKERVKEAKRLFRQEKDSSFFKPTEWGAVMAQLVEEADEGVSTYRELFDYLIASSSEPEAIAERVRLVMRSFFDNTKTNYPLTKVLTQNDLKIENLSVLYANKILKGLDIKWEELFVDSVKNVKKGQGSEKVSATIEEYKRLIGDYLPLWKAFINRCIKAGIKEAGAYNDEWTILAKSKEFDAMRSILGLGMKSYTYSEGLAIKKGKTKSSLGKQIIDLLIFLHDLYYNGTTTSQPTLSDIYLMGIKDIMVEVYKYQKDAWQLLNHNYPKVYEEKLKSMKGYDVYFVDYLLNNKNAGFFEISSTLRVVLQDKLEAARKKP